MENGERVQRWKVEDGGLRPSGICRGLSNG